MFFATRCASLRGPLVLRSPMDSPDKLRVCLSARTVPNRQRPGVDVMFTATPAALNDNDPRIPKNQATEHTH